MKKDIKPVQKSEIEKKRPEVSGLKGKRKKLRFDEILEKARKDGSLKA